MRFSSISGMNVDLFTLYLLAIGTLAASAVMLFWEHRAHPDRSKALQILAAGFGTLAVGCGVVLLRPQIPGIWGSLASNLVLLSGYLLLFNGVAALTGRRYAASSCLLVFAMALVWIVAGQPNEKVIWLYFSSLPIALASGATAWAMWSSTALKGLSARRIVVLVTGAHTVLYAARAFVLPWLAAEYGPSMLLMASKITIYEGVLYSVVLPMALLKLVREEAHGRLVRESQTDYLTRLGNRRWFFEEGGRVIAAHGRHGPVAVLAFDLDHFKSINDVHGHQMGDHVLKVFADIAQQVLGANATVARIGGEEFAALLWGNDARRAEVLGSAIVQQFAQVVPGQFGNIGICATVSAGLAHFEQGLPDLSSGLAAADLALYRAKSLGGNRLEAAAS